MSLKDTERRKEMSGNYTERRKERACAQICSKTDFLISASLYYYNERIVFFSSWLDVSSVMLAKFDINLARDFHANFNTNLN